MLACYVMLCVFLVLSVLSTILDSTYMYMYIFIQIGSGQQYDCAADLSTCAKIIYWIHGIIELVRTCDIWYVWPNVAI